MTKPKDRRSEFNRQHAKILAERNDLLDTIELLSKTKDADISAATKRSIEAAEIAKAAAVAAKEARAGVHDALESEISKHAGTARELDQMGQCLPEPSR